MRKPLEHSIENNVVNYAKRRGVPSVKLNGMGKRSLPDRMFLGAGGRVLFIEFKREGEAPTPLQRHLHKEWAALGFTVHIVDNVKNGRELVDYMVCGPSYRIDLTYPLEDR